jgi:hypothetical protein
MPSSPCSHHVGPRRLCTIGSPHYELLEAQDDGIFGLANGLGFHCVALREGDCEAKRDELVLAGFEAEATSYSADGRIIVAWFKPHHRVEQRPRLYTRRSTRQVGQG